MALECFSRLIADFSGSIRTVAVDHGKEFSCDLALKNRYGILVCLWHVYHSHERGGQLTVQSRNSLLFHEEDKVP
ncbi:hypothetical protein LCALC10_2669 [Lacticaseibacillus paracasei]|nr:hypothetical protein LCALC10_2669 [Lacticaseibacillus paracasei]